MDGNQIKKLEKFALEIRIAEMTEFKARGFGHIGGSMSVTDLFAVLYGAVMKYDPKNPHWEGRDYLVVSKGHSGPALYATLALKGFFPTDWLSTLNQNGTNLPSHCDRNKTPGIDMTTGSLGQGISAALGMALGLKTDKKDNRVYLVLGDGELDEGQIWEGALFAHQFKLGNLIAFVDHNGKQLDGTLQEVMDIGDIAAKFDQFGWHTQTADGHDIAAVWSAVETAKAEQGVKPALIVLNTVKGYGAKPVAETELNHHVTISPETADQIIGDLKARLQEVL